MWGRCLAVLALAQVACRSPLPTPPDQPKTKPVPDAGLPTDDEPNIEPDTGSPVGPGGGEPAPSPPEGSRAPGRGGGDVTNPR